jgi:hypothetical protein
VKLSLARWHAHRALIDRAGLLIPFAPGQRRHRLLFISERDPICQTQLFPYFFHRTDLARKHGIEIRELPLARFREGKHPYHGVRVDAVVFQTWFDLDDTAMTELVTQIRSNWSNAALAYFDWFAPTDLRYAKVLNDHIAVYLKKQVLRDRRAYSQTTLGDTNLTDFFARRYGIDYPPTRFDIPESFWTKLHVGTHFAFSDHMLNYFLQPFPERPHRSIDLHARIAVKGTEWYTAMRQEALDKTQALEQRIKAVCRGRVSRKEYFGELFNAKLCFSPFGYGEVCWRDFEAMFTGSLLLKPDMSHLDCYPEVFYPNETYVPLRWGLDDFEEKVDYYLSHEAERLTIARTAFDRLHNYFREARFLTDMVPLLERLGLAGTPL